MLNFARYAFFLVGLVIVAMVTGMIGACSKTTPEPATTTGAVVPAPPGDSTPKAIDSNASTAMPGNEKSGTTGGPAQSTTGSAASGLPPYSMQSGPEGNPSSAAPDARPAPGTASPEPKK